MSHAKYVSKTRHNAYQFRIVIPQELRSSFKNQREIRRTLQTDSYRVALRKAKFLWVDYQKLFEALKTSEKAQDEQGENSCLLCGSAQQSEPTIEATTPFREVIPKFYKDHEHLWKKGTFRDYSNVFNVLEDSKHLILPPVQFVNSR
jgi:hypothetical protein